MMDVYEELAIDLVKGCGITMFTSRKIVEFLDSNGIIDYDVLKEHYLYDDEE